MIIKTSISLPEELITKSKVHALKTGKTISGMIRLGLEKQLLEAEAK